jgi:zinc/manganese transport system permease protein
MAADAGANLSWDLVSDVRQMLAYHFMVNALWAGAIVAVMAAVVGWFMVLRRQTFAGHTLSLVAFPGATGATLVGLPVALGYFAACSGAALALARVSRRGTPGRSEETAAIGTVQAFALALGFLFVTLYHGLLADAGSLLFGTFLGITDAQVALLAAVAAASLGAVAALGRPLLFVSVDPDVARSRGVPTAKLATAFLLLLGLAVAATAQITGALLVFALLVMPPATAQALTARPGRGLALAVALGVLVAWVSLGIAFFSPYPVGFWVTSLSFALFACARAGRALAGDR